MSVSRYRRATLTLHIAPADASNGLPVPAPPSPRPWARRAATRRDHGGPLAARIVASPWSVTVSCGCAMVAVGLNATRSRIGSPMLMPPCTPPELLVRVRTLSLTHFVRIVVFAAGQRGASKPRANFKAFGGGERHEGFGEVGFELVENRVCPARRHVACHHLDHTPQGIALPARPVDAGNHLFGTRRIGAAHDVRLPHAPGSR